MLKFFLSFFLLSFSLNYLIAQPIDLPYTYPEMPEQEVSNANIPGPENVLVVFKDRGDTTLISVSRAIKDYYVSMRGIPSYNIVPLTIPSSKIYPTGTVVLEQRGELIRNTGSCSESTTEVCDTIAWSFFKEFIYDPIQYALNNRVTSAGDTFKNVVRYILLIKGVPHKVRSGHIWVTGGWAHTTRINVSTDALLCLINNEENIISI